MVAGTIVPEKTRILNGSEIVVKTLEEMGLTTIFGYPGGIVLDLYDELYRNQATVKHCLVRHEQAGVHAAEGFARVSGRCGVVLVTSGPGATNTVTGIANAYLDGYPLLVLTGQVSKESIGKDAFQEVNILDITKSCTKAGFQVTDVRELQKTLNKAHEIAMSGKMGPVVVDISKNVFKEKFGYDENFNSEKSACEDVFQRNSRADYETVAGFLKSAQSPLIVAGGGATQSKCSEELVRLAEILRCKTVNTMAGLGSFPQNNSDYLGMIGLFGNKCANDAVKNADIILSVGARFNDRITSCYKAGELDGKIIQLDVNENEIGRNVLPIKSLVGDAKILLKTLIEFLEKNFSGENTFVKEKIGDFPDSSDFTMEPPETEELTAQAVVKLISEMSSDKKYYVTSEVGQHQIAVARGYEFTFCGQFIASCGSGTMGFGLPAAIGACLADKRRPVICIAGDGSFQMNEQELATIVQYNLPIKIFIINNGYLGMVRQLQEKNCEGRYYATAISNPDFCKLASAYKIPSERANSIATLKTAIYRALNSPGAYITECVTTPCETV